MAADLHRYGSVNPIYFKLTLATIPVTGITLLAADVKLSMDGAAFSNVGASCSETTGGEGWYVWTPASSSLTQCKTGIIDIEATGGNVGLFDPNGKTFITGGDLNAQLDGV